MTNKFKFGDKVTYRSCKNAFYLRKTDDKRSLIAVEKFGVNKGVVITVITDEITHASDWVKCSERLPETYTKVLVLVEVGNDSKQHIFVDELYESTKYGMTWQNNDNLVTHWMPLPAPPMELAPKALEMIKHRLPE